MRCAYPQEKVRPGGLRYSHPCGQCLSCLVNRKETWGARGVFETQAWPPGFSVFVTLTYGPGCLELSPSGVPTVRKATLQGFMKRLRKNTGAKLRYLGAGEYGDVSGRPHYHLVLHGLSALDHVCGWVPTAEECERLDSWDRMRKWRSYSPLEFEILRAWQCRGFVSVGSATFDSACYVAGYAAKSLVARKVLGDSEPEFLLMSRNPAYGTAGVVALADRLRAAGFCPSELAGLSGNEGLQALECGSVEIVHHRSAGAGIAVGGEFEGSRRTAAVRRRVGLGRTLYEKLLKSFGGDTRSRSEKERALDERAKEREWRVLLSRDCPVVDVVREDSRRARCARRLRRKGVL